MITVVGSIGIALLFSLPHLPAVGETVLTPAYTTAMGGKGANQAVAAARDGVRVRFVWQRRCGGFVGVLAAAMDRGLEMQPAMRRACVAASMACTLVGAAPIFPTGVAIDLMLDKPQWQSGKS
jgi:ribokinase